MSQGTVKGKELVYALVGNPNCGKTTIFNLLTGLNQKVANYPGVTIERKDGYCFSQHGERMKIMDLPGAYSLSVHSVDEKILQKVLLGKIRGVEKPDRVICILDASNLERALYLTLQVMELGLPTLLILNMMDVVEKMGLYIDIKQLEEALGVPVISMEANKKKGLLHLKVAMSRGELRKVRGLELKLPEKLREAIIRIQHGLTEGSTFGEAALLLAGKGEVVDEEKTLLGEWRNLLDGEIPNWRSMIIESRYEVVEKIYKEAVFQNRERRRSFSEKIDTILLHSVWGWVVLALVMGMLFWGIFSLSEYPKGLIEDGVDFLKGYVGELLPNGPIKGLIMDGVITGVGGVVAFLPQIMMLFFFIGILESTGYLPRVAYLLDRVMSKVGLHGKSFVPLLSSYACAIPGILSTRTLASRQERLATIMISPWMSCSARLPVYLLLIGLIVPEGRYMAWVKMAIMIGIYAIGTLAALGVAWIFRKTLLRGKGSATAMELPRYGMPSFRNIGLEVMNRSMMFVDRAGKIILGFSIIIWFLTAYPRQELNEVTQLSESYMGIIGKLVEPVLEPLGYDWKVGIALIGSFAARELFVSTMAIIYQGEEIAFSVLTCVSLIIFFIFAMQCMSTFAVVKKETNSWRWPVLQIVYMTLFAYLAALTTYQVGRFLGWE